MKLEGLWSPLQLANALGVHRQTVVDTINGKGKYPRLLPVVRFGQLLFVPEEHAQAFLHWSRTGELLDVRDLSEKLYWTTDEIARASGVHRSTVTKAITGRSGKYASRLPAIKVQEKTWLVRNADALAFIEECKPKK
ncbi:MAG: hypothetical protein H7Y22_06335 [Gemmatimonadaceae bacterium]|nr:hypothetical protein [Gloeobacterales cyanobacterium ES-bin-141]